MRDNWIPEDPNAYQAFILKLRQEREARKKGNRAERRGLSKKSRAVILEKTGGRCHICGGKIEDYWEADHVLAHSGGGEHSTDNYLPAHWVCNNYRWDYLPEEFQEILRLGVWLRTQIEYQTGIGQKAAAKPTFGSF